MSTEHERNPTNSEPVIIFVDADATPRDALASVDELAARFSAHVTTVSSINHEFTRANHITVDAHPQAVDMEIVRRVNGHRKVIVVTQDYGLAALVLGKGAKAVSPKGLIYTEQNIDLLLLEREIHAKQRRSSGRNRGPKARTSEDAAEFRDALQALLTSFTFDA